MDKGHVHIVEKKIPDFYEARDAGDREAVINLYEISTRQSSRIFREMAKACPSGASQSEAYSFIRGHQDYEPYLQWKELQKSTAAEILSNAESYRLSLGVQGIDPTQMAQLFVDKNLDKSAQQEAISNLLKERGLDLLIGIEKQPGQSIDMRKEAKEVLTQAWHADFKEHPEKQSLMLAYSNRDVNDLNTFARALLKGSGHISKEEYPYNIAKMAENDFGHKQTIKEKKTFSKGDRIVFTRNNYGQGVKNGTMGTIAGLDKQTIQVKLDEGKEILFAPNLNPYFDQGWAITIHKSQGTTVDNTYLLASYEMTQNLAYVAMTRHRENVHVFGSSLDFWRPEKLPEALAKSGEKLSAADYLDGASLNKLMQKNDRLLTKIFERVSNELEAMGAVSKKAFWQAADHFLGIKREKEIRVYSGFSKEAVREEARAENILKTRNEPVSKKIAPENPPLENLPLESTEPGETNFFKLVHQCKQRLYHLLERENLPLTIERKERISLQAERTAAFILHMHGETSHLPRESEMVNFSLRAKYELDRLPQIQKDQMDQGETNAYRAYSMADRLASIEGRIYFEALQKGVEEPFNMPFMAKREFNQNQEHVLQLMKNLSDRYFVPQTIAYHFAQDVLRYRETHRENPSSNQMEKMVEISRHLENKEYGYRSYSHDSAESEFLRRREGDLMFRHGHSYDVSRDLELSKSQVNKSLENIQRQMAQERENQKQMELGL